MIHRASLAECDILAAIHASAFRKHDAWSRDVFELQLALPNVIALLHACGGLIVLRAAADEAEVLTLAVTPAARRSGVAMDLLHESTVILSARGVKVIFLEVSVANTAGKALYTACGFKQAGRRRHYYADKTDALVLRLDLDPEHPPDD